MHLLLPYEWEESDLIGIELCSYVLQCHLWGFLSKQSMNHYDMAFIS